MSWGKGFGNLLVRNLCTFLKITLFNPSGALTIFGLLRLRCALQTLQTWSVSTEEAKSKEWAPKPTKESSASTSFVPPSPLPPPNPPPWKCVNCPAEMCRQATSLSLFLSLRPGGLLIPAAVRPWMCAQSLAFPPPPLFLLSYFSFWLSDLPSSKGGVKDLFEINFQTMP